MKFSVTNLTNKALDITSKSAAISAGLAITLFSAAIIKTSVLVLVDRRTSKHCVESCKEQRATAEKTGAPKKAAPKKDTTAPKKA